MKARPVDVRREEITTSVAARLIAELNQELTARYPEEGANHFRLDPEEVEHGRGAFLVAYVGQDAVGCGAIRKLDAGSAEIKRMYVVPSARGLGVGRAMLGALENEARRLDVGRIVLETGERQVEALGLYLAAGYERIPAFGEYAVSPLSTCMEKRLE